MAMGIDTIAEVCPRAAVVISARERPAQCNAMLVDRAVWQSFGAVALRWTGDRFTQTVALPPRPHRPWQHPARPISEKADPPRRQSPREAEPHQDDLTADDQ